MATRLIHFRHSAFHEQSGRCFYCGLPMWESSPEEFSRTFGINPVQAKRLECTADTYLLDVMVVVIRRPILSQHAFTATVRATGCDLPRIMKRIALLSRDRC
jgi:hypothetical protein